MQLGPHSFFRGRRRAGTEWRASFGVLYTSLTLAVGTICCAVVSGLLRAPLCVVGSV